MSSFFSSILQTLVRPKSDKLIRINLYNQALTLWEHDNLIKQAKIAAAGHPKLTPTPTGEFKVLLKDKKHISGISGLIMPLSLRFYNGYYLHGLPTNRSGQIINTVYSNGCVRLPPGWDEEIFNWAEIGTKVQIYNSQLVKTADDPTVYVLTKEGTKEPIPSPEVFISRGFRWKDIVTVPLAEINIYPEVNATKL